VALRLKPVARSLSVRANFFGLELEDWGLVLAWAIVMRLVGDHIHRVFVSFVPVSTVMTYGSAAIVVLVIRWAKHGKPRGYMVALIQYYFRPKAHSARCGAPEFTYVIEDER
jgi:hypothetical protein